MNTSDFVKTALPDVPCHIRPELPANTVPTDTISLPDSGLSTQDFGLESTSGPNHLCEQTSKLTDFVHENSQSFTNVHDKKARPDSVLLNLPENDREQLNEWLLSHSYTKVLELLARPHSEGGLGVHTHRTSLSRYYQRVMPGFIEERRLRILGNAQKLPQTAHQLDLPTIEAIKQRAFEVALNPGSDPKLLKELLRIFLKLQEHQLTRDKFDFSIAQAVQIERQTDFRHRLQTVDTVDLIYEKRRTQRDAIPAAPAGPVPSPGAPLPNKPSELQPSPQSATPEEGLATWLQRLTSERQKLISLLQSRLPPDEPSAQ